MNVFLSLTNFKRTFTYLPSVFPVREWEIGQGQGRGPWHTGEEKRRGLEGPGHHVRDCLATKDCSLNFEHEGHIFILEKLMPSEDIPGPISYCLFMCLEYIKVFRVESRLKQLADTMKMRQCIARTPPFPRPVIPRTQQQALKWTLK